MTDREICEQIVKYRSCFDTPECRYCPLEKGDWECGETGEEAVEAARRWLEDHSPCIWSQDEDGLWHTDCGQMHEFIDGGPADNSYVFCPYCGKEIK